MRENGESMNEVLPTILRNQFGVDGLPLFKFVELEKIQKARYALFANTSLPSEVRTPNLPDFFHDEGFVSLIKEIYKRTCKDSRDSIKEAKAPSKPKDGKAKSA